MNFNTDEIKFYDDTYGKNKFSGYIRCHAYGDTGVGKTTFASTFPKPFVIDADKGGMTLKKLHVPYVTVEFDTRGEIEKVKAIIRAFRDRKYEGGLPEFKDRETLVIDTTSSLSEIWINEIMCFPQNPSKKALQPGRDKASFDEWGFLKAHFISILNMIKDIDDGNVVFLSGAKLEEDKRTGEMIGKPDIEGKIRDAINRHFDFAFYMAAEGTGNSVKYYAYTKPYRQWQAKSRGNLPYKIENPSYGELVKYLSE